MQTAESRRPEELDSVAAHITYLAGKETHARYRTWPPSSGRMVETPPKEFHEMSIYDCRPILDELSLEGAGFVVRESAADPSDFYDDAAVRAEYLPAVERAVARETGAVAVFAFDHNVRSSRAVVEPRSGVRPPADMAHNDYTEASGPRRIREILAERGRLDLAGHRGALINVWRPLAWPAQDVPLAICEAESTSPEDFVDTDIEHYGERDLEHPSHTGQIFSIRYNPRHRWFYVPDMRPQESLIFKCWDSLRSGQARYTAHTGFKNPAAPPDAPPRQSIEVRTVAIYPG
jgi:hypothetical protein